MNPIIRFLRAVLVVALLPVLIVEVIVVISDSYDRYFLANQFEVAFSHGRDCNKVVGAQVLFWSMLAIEMIVLGCLVRMRPTAADLDGFHKVHKAGRANFLMVRAPRWQPPATTVGVLAVIFLCYAASYSVAFGNERTCLQQSLTSRLFDYWVLFAAYAVRGMFLFAGCYLFFERMRRPSS